jgi:hypothetical protein
MARFNFYIDGLNLYYGMLKTRRPDLKWLDLRAMCGALTTDHEVVRVRYFTAPVMETGKGPGPNERQHRYRRALAATGGVDIHLGHFTREVHTMARADGLGEVDVWKTEEKCSDVNLGAHILLDAMDDECDIVALISNDADLRVPISIVAGPQFEKEVWVFNPTPRERCNHLKPRVYSTPMIHLNLRAGVLERSQLPTPVIGRGGRQIHKPKDWRSTRGGPAEAGPHTQGD